MSETKSECNCGTCGRTRKAFISALKRRDYNYTQSKRLIAAAADLLGVFDRVGQPLLQDKQLRPLKPLQYQADRLRAAFAAACGSVCPQCSGRGKCSHDAGDELWEYECGKCHGTGQVDG